MPAKKASNHNLHAAKKAKNDEFYTQLADIEKELVHYKQHFKGKVVLCNCDDPLESNFVKYFSLNFEHLGLKKLIATHYKESNLFSKEPPYKLEYTGDKDGNKVPDLEEFVVEMLDDGDFRSPECEELLEEADIVVTNPPFSLFREYVDQLMLFEKKFLIIGNLNAVSYKEIFPLLKKDKMWFGATMFSGGAAYFMADPDLYDPKKMSNPKHAYVKDGKLFWRVNGVRWFTNLSHKKRHEKLTLYKKYSKKEYPKYDNYDAINVDKVVEIPMDFAGEMGVPISFLDKYNPKQFEIVRFRKGDDGKDLSVNGKCPYFRIVIRNRKPKK